MLSGLTPEQQRLKEFDQEWARKSTFYLGRRVLGYQFDIQPHREICRFVDDDSKKCKLLLAPRGCFKTSVISQAYVTRRIIENPNIRILLDSVALTNSQDNLKVSRRFFEGNQRLRELYGDFTGGGGTWNDTEYVVSKRTDKRLKEPTVRASGIDKVQIGPHYDLIIADDLHNRDNFRTVEQVEKVKEHIRLIFGLLDPGGEFLIGGHRWSYTDAFSMVMGDTDKPDELEFASLFTGNTMIRSATMKDGNLYFPRVHTREHLARQRTALGIEMYAAMLENEPVLAGVGQKFEARYFRRYKTLPCDDETNPIKMNWYMTVDPGGRKKGNDYWVFMEGAIPPNGIKHFVRYKKAISKASMAAEHIYAWWLQRKNDGRQYVKIGFEVAGQQGTTLESIKDYLWDKYHVALPFVELTHTEDSKAARIEALVPQYEMGKIMHSEQMSEAFGLEDQLVKFPKGEDDIADAAAMMDEVMIAPKPKKVERPPQNLNEIISKNIADRMEGRNKIRRIHPVLGSDF